MKCKISYSEQIQKISRSSTKPQLTHFPEKKQPKKPKPVDRSDDDSMNFKRNKHNNWTAISI